MSGKDMIKLLLISYGFHIGIKIEGAITEDGTYMYDVEAYNEEGEYFSDYSWFIDVIRNINTFMDNLRHPDPDLFFAESGEPVEPVKTDMYWQFNNISTKNLLDDKFRDEFYKTCKARDDRQAQYCNDMKPVWEEDERTRPCPNCQENDHSYPYKNNGCSKGNRMTCQKLRRWLDECGKRDREATEKWNKEHEE